MVDWSGILGSSTQKKLGDLLHFVSWLNIHILFSWDEELGGPHPYLRPSAAFNTHLSRVPAYAGKVAPPPGPTTLHTKHNSTM